MQREQASDTYITVTLVSCSCANCGVAFAISEKYWKQRKRDHQTFYCPAGHQNYYPQKSDLELLEAQVAAEREAKMHWQESARKAEQRVVRERRATRAVKGHLTRTKKRVGNGVCPCCNRTFQNLQRHMKCKHKGYKDGK